MAMRREFPKTESIVDADHGHAADPLIAGPDGTLEEYHRANVAGQLVRELLPEESPADERVLRVR